jgi:hypothetical protein
VTVRSYHSEVERARALEAARAEYARTGVFIPPVPAARAAYERTRHHRAAFGITRPDPAPAPGPASAMSAEQVAAVVCEAVTAIDDAQAQSFVARRLREGGATDDQVTGAMRRVQDQRDAQRTPGW